MEFLKNLIANKKFPMIGFLISGGLSILLTEILSSEGYLASAFKRWTYYILWISLFYFVYLLNQKVSFRKFFKWANFKSQIFPVLYSLILTSLLFSAVSPELRVLADETNLLNVSQAFYLNKEFDHPIEVDYYYETFHFISTSVPHRPGLWPFLASILHTVFGYNVNNAFILNFIVGFAIFYVLILFSEIVFSRSLGYFAATILASIPVYALNVTSGGFDPINLLFLLISGLMIYNYLQDSTALNLELLLISVLLGAQCRYESVILFFLVCIAVIWKYRPLLSEHRSFIFITIPFLYLPVLWQRILSPEIVNKGDTGKSAMQLDLVWAHAQNAWEFFWVSDIFEYPNAPLIVILAFLGLGMFLNYFKRIKPSRETIVAFGLITFGIFLIGVIHFAYYLGDYRFPFIMRYSLVFLGYISMFAAIPLYYLYHNKGWQLVAILLTIFLVANYLPVAAKNSRGKSLFLYRDFKMFRKFFNELPSKNILVISDRPSLYAALGIGSVNFPYVNQNANTILAALKKHQYANIYIIQNVQYANGLPNPNEILNSEFIFEPVIELQNSPSSYVRLGRILLRE